MTFLSDNAIILTYEGGLYMQLTLQERRNKIVELINEKGRVSVNKLSELFNISAVVIRADLSELEKQGLLARVHGGAITSYKSYYDMSLMQRLNANASEKKAIAEKLSESVSDSDTLIMNAGTTPIYVMRAIANKRVTIVTNSIALALEGAQNPNFKIILLGGDVDGNFQFTYGISAIKELEQYTADLFIMSVDGIDLKNGISTFYYQEAEICKYMMSRCRRTVVAADHSKIGRTAFAKISDLKEIDELVTDSAADTATLEKLGKRNIITDIAVPK